MTYLLGFLVALLGVAAAVHGERDDSPGLFFLGILLALGAVTVSALRAR